MDPFYTPSEPDYDFPDESELDYDLLDFDQPNNLKNIEDFLATIPNE